MKNSKVNCITINTDASYHPIHKVGGYAFYIICDKFRIKQSGSFKNQLNNSTEAELMAIANAITYLIKIEDVPSTKYIIVNNDCLNAFSRITKNSSDEIGRYVYLRLEELKIKLSIDDIPPTIKLKHVKAHVKPTDGRSYVNDWCDKNAKIKMRELL